MNTRKPHTRLGLETCQDMHEKLKWEARRLEDGWSAYDTFNFVVTANHLYVDWIENCGSQENKSKRDSLPESAKMVMQSIVDLSNGGKHWQISRPNSLDRQVVKAVPERGINDWYAYLHAGPMGYVEFGDYKLSMMELSALVLGYFKWIFESRNIPFPSALQDQLETYKAIPEGTEQIFPQRSK
jgi:hypothetical protein